MHDILTFIQLQQNVLGVELNCLLKSATSSWTLKLYTVTDIIEVVKLNILLFWIVSMWFITGMLKVPLTAANQPSIYNFDLIPWHNSDVVVYGRIVCMFCLHRFMGSHLRTNYFALYKCTHYYYIIIIIWHVRLCKYDRRMYCWLGWYSLVCFICGQCIGLSRAKCTLLCVLLCHIFIVTSLRLTGVLY